MKTKLIVIAAVVGGTVYSATAEEPHQGWHQNFAAADRDAQATGRPLLLHFYADWCGPCRQMEHGVLNSPEVVKLLGTVVVGAKINVDREPGVAQRFGVPSYPFDVLVSPDGEVLLRAGGYAGPDAYVARTRTAAAGFAPKTQVAASTGLPDSNAAPGLEGHSPVSIMLEQKWRKGDAELTCEYQKVIYHFVDESELKLFQADPDRYAPQFRGLDPISLLAENRKEEGDIHHGVFYRQRLYLFSSLAHRDRFMETPDPYTEIPTIALVSGPPRLRD